MKKNTGVCFFMQCLCLILLDCSHGLSQVPGQYVTGQEGPSGGTGGTLNNTYATIARARISSIKVRSGNVIDAIELAYEAGKLELNSVVCGGAGGSYNNTLTLIPGEFIVRVSGKYGTYLEWLYVQTSGSRAQYFEFGNKASTATGYFDYQATPDMVIGNFIIRSGVYVDALGVVLENHL